MKEKGDKLNNNKKTQRNLIKELNRTLCDDDERFHSRGKRVGGRCVVVAVGWSSLPLEECPTEPQDGLDSMELLHLRCPTAQLKWWNCRHS